MATPTWLPLTWGRLKGVAYLGGGGRGIGFEAWRAGHRV